ncbi:Dehydroquinate synthase-like protein [Calocera cornea HHB12733]|uniref:hydroxyacid-oxoacid transhydrogenase n=1 Tax=Calocera cornea HHB12733 TaxID=1353952 RepID=A0A165IL60_9BASI|nr:Dehydroquinate synthase-like protein [Calocera cornea HHB12733]
MRLPPAPRQSILSLLRHAQHTACPCHACRSAGSGVSHALAGVNQLRRMATPVDGVALPQKEYAFEVAAANLRFGEGVTKEVGMDLKNMGATKVGLFSDANVALLPPVRMAIDSLEENGVPYELFTDVSVEPTDASWRRAIDWSRQHDFSHFLAVGGGSVMDTAKCANLFTVYKDADLFDFINAPVGKGLPIGKTLRPLIAVPTTAGTGSETTGTAILDIPSQKFKTGIANRALRPILGIVDTLNTDTCPRQVHISSGLDVLFHSLESYTAIPYFERTPRPDNPLKRPAYQGRNPISDVFSMWALQQTVKYLPRVAKDMGDREAKNQMLLAATFAGIGFGNAGVHICHAASYPISGLNKTGPKWKHPEYLTPGPIIPHGISVALTGPAVFEFTAPSDPGRHREAAAVFAGVPVSDPSIARVPDSDVGQLLFDSIAKFLDSLGVPRGLRAIGYNESDVAALVEGTLPQRRVLDLAPGIGDVPGEDGREHLTRIITASLEY